MELAESIKNLRKLELLKKLADISPSEGAVEISTLNIVIIYLPGKLEDVLYPLRACAEVVLMSTYEELQLIVSVAVLIVAILSYTHKK